MIFVQYAIIGMIYKVICELSWNGLDRFFKKASVEIEMAHKNLSREDAEKVIDKERPKDPMSKIILWVFWPVEVMLLTFAFIVYQVAKNKNKQNQV